MKIQLVHAALAVSLIATGAAAYAQIRGDGATISVCVGKRHTVVSALPSGKCPPGSDKVSISRVGPAGAAGATGATGAIGAAGATGATGTAGQDGADGRDGADGAPGAPGSDFPRPAVTLAGVTAAAIGDSNTARNGPWGYPEARYVPQLAWFHLASTRVGQRVRLVDDFAVSGTRADQMLADQVPQVLAMTPRPAIVPVMAGTNDVTQGRSADQIIASLDATYDQLTRVGIKVVAGTILPSDQWTASPALGATVDEVNQWIRGRAGVDVVDFNAALADGSGAPRPGVLMDGTHISTVGAAMMGRTLAPVLEHLAPAVDPFPVAGASLLTSADIQARGDGFDAEIESGFAPGDRVVAIVEFTTDVAADTTLHQVELTLAAGSRSTGLFTDTAGYDGPDVALSAVPRRGVLMTLPLQVPDAASHLQLALRATGSAVQVGRVALVKVV